MPHSLAAKVAVFLCCTAFTASAALKTEVGEINLAPIYVNTGDDNAVNAGVKRYAADSRAADYLRSYYTFTGHLARPLLAVHTTYDPIVAPDIPSGELRDWAEQGRTPQGGPVPSR